MDIEVQACINGWIVLPKRSPESNYFPSANAFHVFNDAGELAKHIEKWAEENLTAPKKCNCKS